MNLNELTLNLLQSEDRYRERPSIPPTPPFFADQFRDLDNTQPYDTLYPIIGNEGRTRAVLSSIFWKIISSSEFFRHIMKEMGAGDPLNDGGRLILTMHKLGDQRRYDLLVLSARLKPAEVQSIPLAELLWTGGATPKDFLEITAHWLDSRYDELFSQTEDPQTAQTLKGQELLLDAIKVNPQLVEELISSQEFSVMLAQMPRTIPTNQIGSPAWGIALSKQDDAISTAGVATIDSHGRTGVTASLHGVVANPENIVKMWNDHGASCVLNQKIYVGGEEGVIRSADLITDSCFIEVAPAAFSKASAINGPLIGKSPYRKEPVTFEGLISKKQNTFITEVDVGIPLVSRSEQVKVYTQPVTNPGDSGSALINADNYVVGFSHRRTGLGEPIEFAEWIWAHSVYAALQLS